MKAIRKKAQQDARREVANEGSGGMRMGGRIQRGLKFLDTMGRQAQGFNEFLGGTDPFMGMGMGAEAPRRTGKSRKKHGSKQRRR